MKRKIAVLVVAAVMLFAFGSMVEATVANKQLQVNYNNVKIVTNGKALSVSTAQEPFLVNGVTFVPLRVAGEALNSTVHWDAPTKTVQITSNAAKQDGDLAVQLALKNQEIANLKKQVADLQAKVDGNSGKSDKDKDDLSDLEDDLMDDFDKLKDVYFDEIKLDGDEDDVDVEVAVDLDDYDSEWEKLTDKNIKDWVTDFVKYIQDDLTKDTVVNGVIFNKDDDEELVEFYKKGKGKLSVDIMDDYYRGSSDKADDVIDSLLYDRFNVDTLRFTIFDIEYDEYNDVVRVNFEAEDADTEQKWVKIKRTTIEDAVERIGKDIANEFKDEKVKVETVRLFFYDEDDDVLGSYRYRE